MRKIIICLSLFLVILIGCGGPKATQGITKTIETDQAKTTVTVTSDNDWCPEGSTIKTETPQGIVSAVVKGEESSGKFAGYCHMVTTANIQGQTMEVDYYYNEEGSGYQVFEVNGQKMEAEWQKS